jgi:hypothetical protein
VPKYSRRKKTTLIILRVKVEFFYENKKCAHIIMLVMFAQILLNLVFQLVINQGLASNTMQFVQFAIIMYLLFFSRLVTNFENMRFLLELPKIKHC